MIRDLEARWWRHRFDPRRRLRTGLGDFVEQISAELPLQVIADLMVSPKRTAIWSSNGQPMIGSDDPSTR